MQNSRLKIWSCLTLLLFWSFAGLQGDVRLEPLQMEVMAQTAPQECKDAAGMTIPCPPDTGDQGDQGRTDCEDTDRDGVCDADEPRECVGQPNELGNGCEAGDERPTQSFDASGIPGAGGAPTGRTLSTYPDPKCDELSAVSQHLAKLRSGQGDCQPDLEFFPQVPVLDCSLVFAFGQGVNGFSCGLPPGSLEDTCSAKDGSGTCVCSGKCTSGDNGCKCEPDSIAAAGTGSENNDDAQDPASTLANKPKSPKSSCTSGDGKQTCKCKDICVASDKQCGCFATLPN